MPRTNGLEKKSYSELVELRLRIDRLMAQKQNAERAALRERMTAMAKEHGFDLRELLDGRRKGKVGGVAVTSRDP